jgi:hypothetical protein
LAATSAKRTEKIRNYIGTEITTGTPERVSCGASFNIMVLATVAGAAYRSPGLTFTSELTVDADKSSAVVRVLRSFGV